MSNDKERITKLKLDEDWNIVDPEEEVKNSKKLAKISSEIAELKARRSWIMQDVYDIDEEILELEVKLKQLQS